MVLGINFVNSADDFNALVAITSEIIAIAKYKYAIPIFIGFISYVCNLIVQINKISTILLIVELLSIGKKIYYINLDMSRLYLLYSSPYCSYNQDSSANGVIKKVIANKRRGMATYNEFTTRLIPVNRIMSPKYCGFLVN